MSFIFARKYLNRIRIFADNKMTVDSNDESILIKDIGMELYRKIKSLGIIKNVIINEDICVCSAGILEDYNELLKFIDDKKQLSFNDICNKALEINIKTKNRTDFIICTVKDKNYKIIEIKDNIKSETDSSWIGSYECFKKFQSVRLDKNIYNQTIYDCESKKEIEVDSEIIDGFAFEETLKSNVDSSVGKILVECVSENGKFYYMDKLFSSMSKPRTIAHGHPIHFYDSVFDGGYTYYVYKSSENYKMYINQLECGIEYCPHVNHEKYNHLRIPKFEYCCTEDFEKKHSCGNHAIIM